MNLRDYLDLRAENENPTIILSLVGPFRASRPVFEYHDGMDVRPFFRGRVILAATVHQVRTNQVADLVDRLLIHAIESVELWVVDTQSWFIVVSLGAVYISWGVPPPGMIDEVQTTRTRTIIDGGTGSGNHRRAESE